MSGSPVVAFACLTTDRNILFVPMQVSVSSSKGNLLITYVLCYIHVCVPIYTIYTYAVLCSLQYIYGFHAASN